MQESVIIQNIIRLPYMVIKDALAKTHTHTRNAFRNASSKNYYVHIKS